mmetsp:Transcript_19306/g.41530  ORF Transcript_19306/g.41530 Transcript_19306/m.41530 type:complete len:514 (+) Transcript_19306:108-1649(+)|eukprot:CAMPEP_0168764736 /NCGR_PEP_ID=MMETSP0724-20121128/25025_1 /TAXON_ID=265536 /ORGANISM="Amphiprora sp., Strain CCMP467" /LENGTH=513 /DNA_ID=CAMNT_0008813965 /DNA_START=113 /DNA_END=1654 /DNA_ORIENTATION=+
MNVGENKEQGEEEDPSQGETDEEQDMDDYGDDDNDGDEDSEDYSDDYDDDDSDAALDDLSISELEEMAASTQRSLLMVQMQLAQQEQQNQQQQQQRQQQRQQQQQQRQQFLQQQQQQLQHQNQNQPVVTSPPQKSPQEQWQDYLAHFSRVKVLKLTDAMVADMMPPTTNDNGDNNSNNDNNEMIPRMLQQLHTAIDQHGAGITHVILGTQFLARTVVQQQQLYSLLNKIWKRHGATITYLKLGSEDDAADPSVLGLSTLFSVLLPNNDDKETSTTTTTFNLTELELASFCVRSKEHIASLQTILNRAPKLKQLNLVGVVVSLEGDELKGLVDPLFSEAGQAPALDECRFTCTQSSTAAEPLLSATCLKEMLQAKPKWWRLGMDGLGLRDEHCRVLAAAMGDNANCKAGDLLSLTRNPHITNEGFHQLFSVLFQKQRMGLVKVDNLQWQANFDLVRSMNNLHGRLGFFEAGAYASRIHWIQWLAQLSQITWEDDAHKTNYLWFTILERPDFVHT